MPRTSNRGGARTGTPGKAYANRTDMQMPVSSQPSSQYGERATLERSQHAVPMAGGSAPSTPSGSGPPPQQAPPGPLAGSLGGLDRSTDFPSEPVTTGVSIGAGAGTEALSAPQVTNATANRLRGLYQRYPSAGLADLIQNLDED